MAIIKEGFDGKETKLRVSGRASGTAELWIEQTGLTNWASGDPRTETLSYATINELIELRDEINEAIKTMAGVGSKEPL